MSDRSSVDMFFGEIQKNAEVSARRKVSAEHRALKKEVTELRKFKANAKKIIREEKAKLAKSSRLEAAKKIKERTYKYEVMVREKRGLIDRERRVHKREKECALVEDLLKRELSVLDRLKDRKVGEVIRSWRRSRWYDSQCGKAANRIRGNTPKKRKAVRRKARRRRRY